MQHQTFSRPVSLVSVAALADVAWIAQWETHLLPLKQAGLVTFWSERQLLAGVDRVEQLFAHLDQADCIVLFLSADFFGDDRCLMLMQRALVRKLNNAIVLIPLLLRPVEWQDSALGLLRCLPTNEVPVTQWSTQDEAFHACVQGLRSLLKLPAHRTTPIHSGTRFNTNRERMLRRLRRSYRDLLAQSLQGMVWMELEFTGKPDAVQNVTNLALRISQQAEQSLLPGMSITQVYEDTEQELLILGEPGAGKSTELLHLAQYLVVQAEQDETCLLPVVLPLSSWAVKQAKLEDWMAEQIAMIYDIPQKVSRQWVQDEQILPLLDGLDEMEEAARPACISAINAYHRAHLTPLVVCSRTAEYESAANKQRLLLQSAVVIRPLAPLQVEAVLDRGGEAVVGLRNRLHAQPELAELATSPLMLSVLMLTYQGTTIHTDMLNEMDLEQQIWTDYVQRMMGRKQKGRTKRYSPEQTNSWLNWLAQQMRLHNQTIFYVEHLQADWLVERLQRAYTWLGLRFPAIIIGVFVSLLVWLFLGDSRITFQLTDGTNDRLVMVSLGGLLGGFLGGWLSPPVGEQTVSIRKKYSFRLGSSILLGVLLGASFGLSLNGASYMLREWLYYGMSYGISFGVSWWILLWLLLRVSRPSSSSLIRPTRRRFFRSRWLNGLHFRRALVITLVWGTTFGLGSALSFTLTTALENGLYGSGLSLVLNFISNNEPFGYGLSAALNTGLSAGLRFAPSVGFAGFFLSAILGYEGGTFRLAERLRWNGRHLIRLGHLRDSILFASLLVLVFWPIFLLSYELGLWLGSVLIYQPEVELSGGLNVALPIGLSYGLSIGLISGLSYWLLFGLYQGLVQERIEDQDRRSFNQGIRRSLRNGILISLLGGGLAMGIGILGITLGSGLSGGLSSDLGGGQSQIVSSGMNGGLSYGVNVSLSWGWFFAISAGLIVWGVVGGLTILRHYIIRLLLARSHMFPWCAQAFLDDATSRILMRRVGGGYSFVHRRLLDYFADAHSLTVKE